MKTERQGSFFQTILKCCLVLAITLAGSGVNAQWLRADNGIQGAHQAIAIGAADQNNAAIRAWIDAEIRCAIMVTHDGGVSWQEMPGPEGVTSAWTDIAMVSGQHVVGVDGTSIYTTKDHGDSWFVTESATFGGNMFNYVEMLDSLNGVAMADGDYNGDQPLFLRTADGGETWTSVCQQEIGEASYDLWRPLDFVSSDVGFFSPFQSHCIYKTVDGGATWTDIGYDFGGSLSLVKARNENQILVFDRNALLATTDGGQSWHTTQGIYPLLGGFAPEDGRYVWAGNLELCCSADSGKTWHEQLSREDFDLENENPQDMVMLSANVGWLLTSRSVWRTVNGGGGVPTAVGENSGSPVEFDLHQNYPNPFNPETQLRYTIHQKSEVSLDVFDVKGRLVRRLVSGSHGAGLHQAMWDGCDASGGRLPSGVYIAKLTVGEQSLCRKMQMVK